MPNLLSNNDVCRCMQLLALPHAVSPPWTLEAAEIDRRPAVPVQISRPNTAVEVVGTAVAAQIRGYRMLARLSNTVHPGKTKTYHNAEEIKKIERVKEKEKAKVRKKRERNEEDRP